MPKFWYIQFPNIVGDTGVPKYLFHHVPKHLDCRLITLTTITDDAISAKELLVLLDDVMEQLPMTLTCKCKVEGRYGVEKLGNDELELSRNVERNRQNETMKMKAQWAAMHFIRTRGVRKVQVDPGNTDLANSDLKCVS